MRTWLAGAVILPLLSSMMLFSAELDKYTENVHSGSISVLTATKEKTPALTHEEKLEQHVTAWIQELSGSDARFAKWPEAKRSVYPLGPGSSAWLIILSREGQDIGYLVAGDDTEGNLKLVEYGTGSFPLFSTNNLHRELVRAGLISNHTNTQDAPDLNTLRTMLDRIEPVYYNPFEAFWEVSHNGTLYFFDAQTSQRYEFDQRPKRTHHLAFTLSLAPHAAAAAGKLVSLEAFDPYDHFQWLVSDPIAHVNDSDFMKMLDDGERFTFFTSLYENTIKAPFAVTGYQSWANAAYVRIEDEGERYISYPIIQQFGELYSEP